jgi:alanine racemase
VSIDSDVHSSLTSGGRLTIDLGALKANYRLLQKHSSAAETAAVVKADAYGLGTQYVVPTLVAAGVKIFYVAQIDEGIEVRKLAPNARIFVIYGAPKGTETTLSAHNLMPLICSAEQLDRWGQHIRKTGAPHAYGLHVDTGMNRSGLTMTETRLVGMHSDVLKASGLCHIMTHPACADEPDHPLNARQIVQFQELKSIFLDIESSFANSAALLSGGNFGGDVTRPGIALYGGEALNNAPNLMKPVVKAEARIIQIRYAKAGETVSYGASETLKHDTKIAVCAVGYADGYHRSIGLKTTRNEPGNDTPRARNTYGNDAETVRNEYGGRAGFVCGRRVPILGRVTMDFTMFDVTDVPDAQLDEVQWVELFGENIALDDVARAGGTIGYELLTSLGRRYERVII